ncbi:hypothetical protein D3C74_369760 [compost metagenome]
MPAAISPSRPLFSAAPCILLFQNATSLGSSTCLPVLSTMAAAPIMLPGDITILSAFSARKLPADAASPRTNANVSIGLFLIIVPSASAVSTRPPGVLISRMIKPAFISSASLNPRSMNLPNPCSIGLSTGITYTAPLFSAACADGIPIQTGSKSVSSIKSIIDPVSFFRRFPLTLVPPFPIMLYCPAYGIYYVQCNITFQKLKIIFEYSSKCKKYISIIKFIIHYL